MPVTIDYRALRASPYFQKHVQVIYEDGDVLALNKPAKIAVHPGGTIPAGRTMLDLARAYMLDQPHAEDIALVHRLDQETSGVLLCAKHAEALDAMETIIRTRQMAKTYLALVKGKVKPEQGTIKSRLTTVDEDRPQAYMRMSADEQGKTAITHFHVERHFGPVATLVKLKLETGRMHQIRVHMQAQGHPIWGDGRYGDFKFNKKIAKPPYALKRQFLHALSVTFPHPISRRTITIRAEMPDDLTHVLEILSQQWQAT